VHIAELSTAVVESVSRS